MNKFRILILSAGAALLPMCAINAVEVKQDANLLFIIVDQLRWDAMGCAGNATVKTPNMDRLARQGARFTRAYASCPVCVPSRASIFTGMSVETHRVFDNKVAEIGRDQAVPSLPSFDQVLFANGYRGEYHGKYHNPYRWAMGYDNAVRPINGAIPKGSKATMNETKAFLAFLERNAPYRPLQAGEFMADRYDRAYLPFRLDPNYGKTENLVEDGRGSPGKSRKSSQGETYGVLVDVPEHATLNAFTAFEALEAIDRLKAKKGPFTLTVSIDPPHPPFVVNKRYFDMYRPEDIPVPRTISDPRTNSPYIIKDVPGPDNKYGNAALIQEGLAIYYGLVSETDAWIGKILDRLDESGLQDNTLVILTADHGEMMGDHGMHSKNIFYESSVRIPLLMRYPNVIPAGLVLEDPVSSVDYFSTILDYLRVPAPVTEGKSIKPIIDGVESGKGRVVFSEWPDPRYPGFMVFDGRWKLMFGRSPDGPSLDALYDISADPDEMENLLGSNPKLERFRPEAERLKGLLVKRLEAVKSPAASSVKLRPIKAQAALKIKRVVRAESNDH